MIETVDMNTLGDVLPLIRSYLEFYGFEEFDQARYRRFLSQFGENSDAGCQFLYRDETGQAVAFATVYFSFVTSIASKIAVMNDLYTMPEHRGCGIGRKLVNHCLDYAQGKGAARLQWLTGTENIQAHALYDSMGAASSLWKVYTCQQKG